MPGDGDKDTKIRELGYRDAELRGEAANKGDRGAKNRPEKWPDVVAERGGDACRERAGGYRMAL